jgi:hypothetical protein
MSTQEALNILESEYGDLDTITEEAVYDGICPAVCIQCGSMSEMEPDIMDGWCDVCNQGSMKSLLILRGII